MKRRLFDKEVEIARQNTALLASQSDYLSTLAILVLLLVTLVTLFVQVFLEYAKTQNSLAEIYVIFFAILMVVIYGALLFVNKLYKKELQKRASDFDDIPNAVAAHAKWILCPDDKDDKHFFVLADGRVIEGFDERGRPRFKKNNVRN